MSDVKSENAKRAVATNIGRRLKALGWTRYRLAKATGMSLPTIINICNGANEPSVSKLKTIADALDTTTDSLLEENSRKVAQPA